MDPNQYKDREQAFVKHFVLREYLQRLVYKVGMFRKGVRINYVDGFSGPWKSASEEHTDTSPYIALQELTKAQQGLDERGRRVEIAGLFVETDQERLERLRTVVARFADVTTEVIHGKFEDQVDEVVRFCGCGSNPFAFVFIDPTGWTGFGLREIAPILRFKPSEVLINFMTKDIIRFIDKGPEAARKSFDVLFGSDEYREQWRDLDKQDRVDKIVETYCRRVREVGGFEHCVSSVVLDPQHDRQHYHLVYGTRSLKGLVTFREVEEKALEAQREMRTGVRASRRMERSDQLELYGGEVLDSRYMDELIERYRSQARQDVERLLQQRRVVPYEEVVSSALSSPATSHRVLKTWLKQWKKAGWVLYEGLGQREQVPKVGRRHRLRWLEQT